MPTNVFANLLGVGIGLNGLGMATSTTDNTDQWQQWQGLNGLPGGYTSAPGGHPFDFHKYQRLMNFIGDVEVPKNLSLKDILDLMLKLAREEADASDKRRVQRIVAEFVKERIG